MPLVRLEVRNEYALGQPELYKEVDREDPKAVLDGVAVAGLVGILRQLGDLAEFAAEVFHGLQEQVMTTASRSHKLKARVQRIEAALPPLEKAILAQTSHIHFAYTVGSEWHPHIRNEQNHFIYNDLPRFIMDSYEECRDPPRLHLLDKFDTGGPGSCLKRYSDPTLFRKASGTSSVTTGKIQIDKKARRSKKKRSSQGSGQLLRGASISNGSSRLQFASPTINGQTSPLQTASAVDTKSNSDRGDHLNSFDSSGLPVISHIVNRQTSPSQTASTVDMTMKSDPGDYLNSFDSRTGSGYIECVFHLSSSMQPEQQESPSSRLMQHNETLDSVFPEEQTKSVDYNIPSSSLQEQIASSSCVTWDEKAEIVEPSGERSDGEEAPEMLWTKSNADSHGGRAVDLTNINQTDSLLETSLELTSSWNQIDDIESEPDNYMDALNTIESESENDLDSQTKREVERYTSSINDEEIDEIHELHVNSADHSPPELESDTASCSSSTEGIPSNISNSFSPESFAHEQIIVSDLGHSVEEMPQIVKLSSNLDNSVVNDFGGTADVLDGSNLESVIIGPLSSASKISDFKDPSRDKIISNLCESQETSGDFSGVHSMTFWTNGGLLGLEPSKPPDFTMPTTVGQDSVDRSKDETVGPSARSCMLEGGDDHEGEKDILAKRVGSIEKDSSCVCSTSCQDDQEEGVSIKKTDRGFSQTDSDANCERFSVIAPKTTVPVVPDIKSISAEASSGNDENSSLVFGLSRRLLANGLSKKGSFVHEDDPELGSSMNGGGLEQCSGHYGVVNQKMPETTFEEQFGHGSPIDSLTSSPPLEHMKISFHPLNGFETSKLKLKFPDGNQCFESVRDVFPSFQLVPEPDMPLNDFGFESDDDTFCRSSPCKSSDCHSHYSESNSEQWESGETPERRDLELYDALCEISSAESMVSSLELGGMANNGICNVGGTESVESRNGVEPSLSGPFLDLPNFDTVNPVQQETNEDSNLLKLECSGQPTPQPPPPPPVQWCVSKPHLDVTEDKHDDVSEALTHASDLKLLGSAVFQQPKLAPAKQQHADREAATIEHKSKHQDQQKFNGQKEVNQASNGKGMDDREDFLQQIRSKSFNLRSTMSTKPTNTAGPTTNVKVTAILEKANAIRQAVGSDDGDDDAWSDA